MGVERTADDWFSELKRDVNILSKISNYSFYMIGNGAFVHMDKTFIVRVH